MSRVSVIPQRRRRMVLLLMPVMAGLLVGADARAAAEAAEIHNLLGTWTLVNQEVDGVADTLSEFQGA